MKNRKRLLLLLIITICLVAIVMGILFKIKSSKKENDQGREYVCKKSSEWIDFDFKSVDGEDLGQYRWEYSISFSIKDNKEITNLETQEKYYFTNHLGYNSLERNITSDFKEQLEEDNLKKIYISNSFAPVKYEDYMNNDNPINDYITDIEILGYICEEV